ncbi:MAG: ATP-binding protein [Candidatus Freyarchaeota archaeon]
MEPPPPSLSWLLTVAAIIVILASLTVDLYLLLRRQHRIMARGFYTKRIRTTFTCTLRVTSVPRDTKQVQRISTRKDLANAVTYAFQHLTSLWEGEIGEASYEIHTNREEVSIMFHTHHTQRNEKEAFTTAYTNLQALKTSLQTNYPGILVEPVEFGKLRSIVEPLIPRKDTTIKKHKHSILIRNTDEDRHLSLVHLKKGVELMPREETTQIDLLIESLLAHNMDARLVVHFRRRRKPRLKRERVKRRRGEPLTIPEQMELTDWRTDQVDNRLGRATGYWRVSAYLLLTTQTEAEARIRAKQASHILTTIYSGPLYGPEAEIFTGGKILKNLHNIASRRSVGKTADLPSTRLAALVHLPEKPLPGLRALTQADFEIPPSTIFKPMAEVPAALVLHREREVYTCTLDPDELCRGMAVLGRPGTGKTRFLGFLLKMLLRKKRGLPVLIFESKGELASLATLPEIEERVLILCPGTDYAPLRINLFDPGGVEPEEYSRKLQVFLTEILENYFGGDAEFSPQMSRVLGEVLPEVVGNPSLRSFEGLFQAMDSYSARNRDSYSFVENTVLALKSRLEIFRRGVLRRVFDTPRTNVPMDYLLNRVVVVNLGPFLGQGGTKDAVQILLGVLALQVFQAALGRRSTTSLQHLLVVDDARFLVPDIYNRRSSGDTTAVEDMITVERGKGQGVIVACQDPAVSKVVLANCATYVVFQLSFQSTSEKEFLELELGVRGEEQRRHLVSQPPREAVMRIPRYPYPFRVRTFRHEVRDLTPEEIERHNRTYHPKIYREEWKETEDAEPPETGGLERFPRSYGEENQDVHELERLLASPVEPKEES